MRQDIIQAPDFWDELERNITVKVDAALGEGETTRAALATYLRDLEVKARCESNRRQTIQIIASGRSLLGDRTRIGLSDGPFSRTS
jgi:hypothetical protein